MEYQELQQAVKSDLRTIPTLKMGILSASDLYGSLASFVLKLSIMLLCINLGVRAGLHSIGLYYSPLSIGSVFACWGLTLISSGFVMLFLSNFILFSRLVKGRLKTEAFIKKKCQHFSLLFLLIYGIAYLVLIAGLDAFGGLSGRDSDIFELIMTVMTLGGAQLGSLVLALLFTNILASIEISRLGMGIAFDVINTFVAFVKQDPHAEVTPEDGSDV